MISLKRYFTPSVEELEKTLQVVHVLVKGIGQHAIEGGKSETDQFRAAMNSYASSIQDHTQEQDLSLTADAVLKSVEVYNRRTSTLIRAQSKDLSSMVAMMSDTIVKIGGATETTAARLHDIEKQLVAVSAVDDVHTLKALLADCLNSVRSEMESHRSDSAATINALQNKIDKTSAPSGESTEIDPVTALPSARAAEAALTIAAGAPSKYFVAIFVVNRVQLINARFGCGVGDQILNVARDHLAASLTGQLFRWRGPSLMVLLQRPAPLEQVRGEVQRVASCKLEKDVDLGSRSVLLPITLAWTVFPMLTSARLIGQKADAFVAAQLPAE